MGCFCGQNLKNTMLIVNLYVHNYKLFITDLQNRQTPIVEVNELIFKKTQFIFRVQII